MPKSLALSYAQKKTTQSRLGFRPTKGKSTPFKAPFKAPMPVAAVKAKKPPSPLKIGNFEQQWVKFIDFMSFLQSDECKPSGDLSLFPSYPNPSVSSGSHQNRQTIPLTQVSCPFV